MGTRLNGSYGVIISFNRTCRDETTLSVQNLALIKFGDWKISDFWRGFNLAIQNIG